MTLRYAKHLALRVAIATSLVGLFTGCTPSEENEVVTTLESALNNLQQNRALTEQFVRDVKANVSPADPQYAELMDSYQEARDVYDRYLDSVEDERTAVSPRSLRRSEPINVQNVTADFLADATTALKPALNTRRIPFQRAVIIPENLRETLHKLPKRSRDKIINRFDDQLRWRSWSQL